MKHIKLFERFSKNISEMYYGGRFDFIGEYGPQDFDEFVEAVREWEEKTGSSCSWSLYPGTVRLSEAKLYWNSYVKPGKKMVLIEGDVSLFAVVVDGDGNIEHCVDNKDQSVKDEAYIHRIESVIKKNI